MKVTLTPNSQQNPQFGMFKADPKTVETLNNMFNLSKHTPDQVFKVSKGFLQDLCQETPAKKIDELVEKHPNTFATLKDYFGIAGSSDSFATAEELVAHAEPLPKEVEAAINNHSTILETAKTALSDARTNAFNALEQAGLNLLG